MKTIGIRMTAISLLVLVSSFALTYAQNREVTRRQAESVETVLTSPDVQVDLLTRRSAWSATVSLWVRR